MLALKYTLMLLGMVLAIISYIPAIHRLRDKQDAYAYSYRALELLIVVQVNGLVLAWIEQAYFLVIYYIVQTLLTTGFYILVRSYSEKV